MQSRHIDSRIQTVIQLLRKTPSRTLQELASDSRLSTSRLTHLFKQETGSTVKHYRRGHRLHEAARMLTSTDMSIKEIAYHLGYRHTSSFVRAFTVEFGLSPSRYRKRLASAAAA
jgi:AraC family transcriptional regulator, arabinose operon regulatory protein